MASKKRLFEGDIFFVQYGGKYFFGKILMDISERMPTRDISMKFFHDCYLVGVYKGIYDEPALTDKEFIIPSIYTLKKQFYLKDKEHKTDWIFYKNESIDYKTDISFPEYLHNVGKIGICFMSGELQIRTKLTKKDYLGDFGICRAVHFWYSTVLMMACHYQGRDELIDDLMDFTTGFLEREDLRFAKKQRKEVYEQIGEDMNISYYELALKHGFNLGRFY